MFSASSGRAGRPPGSSRDMLQEAAAELFLEQTYAGTTIAQIARRAGVSRNTFFNYFPAKSDLLWVDVDEALAQLPAALHAAAVQTDVMEAVRLAMMDLASRFGPSRVPWALTQSELMHATGELVSLRRARPKWRAERWPRDRASAPSSIRAADWRESRRWPAA